MAPVAGFNALLGIGTASPVDVPLDFLSETLAANEQFLDRSGLRGTRSHINEIIRRGTRRIEGQLNLQPTAVEWASLLPWILGAAAVGTTYALAETVPERYVTVKRSDGTDGKVFEYNGCKINKATLRCQAGQLVTAVLDVVGIDETITAAGTFPSLTLDTTTAPFVFMDCALSIAATTYQARDLDIVIDNKLDTERFLNSATRTAIVAQDREISVNLNVPYGDAEALYNTGPDGVAMTATFTNGAVSMLFSFVKVGFPRRSPTVPGKQEIFLPLQGIARKSSSTNELVVTLDSTP